MPSFVMRVTESLPVIASSNSTRTGTIIEHVAIPSGNTYWEVQYKCTSPARGYNNRNIYVPDNIDLNSIRITKVTRSETSSGDAGTHSYTTSDEVLTALQQKKRTIKISVAFLASKTPSYANTTHASESAARSAAAAYTVQQKYGWNKIEYTVTYEPLGDYNDTLTISNVGSVSYGLFKNDKGAARLAGNESVKLLLTVNAIQSINGSNSSIQFSIRKTPSAVDSNYTGDGHWRTISLPSVTAGNSGSKETSLSLTTQMKNDLASDNGYLQVRIVLNGTDSNPQIVNSAFRVRQTRPLPSINSISFTDIGETSGGYSIYSYYGGLISGYSIPKYIIGAEADTTTFDSLTRIKQIQVLAGKLVNNEFVEVNSYIFDSLNDTTSSKEITYKSVLANNYNAGSNFCIKVTVTDNYGASTTVGPYGDGTLTSLPILTYSPPKILPLSGSSSYEVLRYIYDSINDRDVPSPLGELLYFLGKAQWNASINGHTNNCAVRIEVGNVSAATQSLSASNYSGGVVKFVDTVSDSATELKGNVFFSGYTYSVNTTYNVTIYIYDSVGGYSNKIGYTTKVIKGSPYLNIEKTGVGIGGVPTGTTTTPICDIYYPIKLHYGTYTSTLNDRVFDTGWQWPTPNATYFNSGSWVKVRRIGNIVNLVGRLDVTSDINSGSSVKVCGLGAQYSPTNNATTAHPQDNYVQIMAAPTVPGWLIRVTHNDGVYLYNYTGAADHRTISFNMTYFVD